MAEVGYHLEEHLDKEVAEGLMQRIIDSFEPHAKYWRERFKKAAPAREAKRRMHEEWERRCLLPTGASAERSSGWRA